MGNRDYKNELVDGVNSKFDKKIAELIGPSPTTIEKKIIVKTPIEYEMSPKEIANHVKKYWKSIETSINKANKDGLNIDYSSIKKSMEDNFSIDYDSSYINSSNIDAWSGNAEDAKKALENYLNMMKKVSSIEKGISNGTLMNGRKESSKQLISMLGNSVKGEKNTLTSSKNFYKNMSSLYDKILLNDKYDSIIEKILPHISNDSNYSSFIDDLLTSKFSGTEKEFNSFFRGLSWAFEDNNNLDEIDLNKVSKKSTYDALKKNSKKKRFTKYTPQKAFGLSKKDLFANIEKYYASEQELSDSALESLLSLGLTAQKKYGKDTKYWGDNFKEENKNLADAMDYIQNQFTSNWSGRNTKSAQELEKEISELYEEANKKTEENSGSPKKKNPPTKGGKTGGKIIVDDGKKKNYDTTITTYGENEDTSVVGKKKKNDLEYFVDVYDNGKISSSQKTIDSSALYSAYEKNLLKYEKLNKRKTKGIASSDDIAELEKVNSLLKEQEDLMEGIRLGRYNSVGTVGDLEKQEELKLKKANIDSDIKNLGLDVSASELKKITSKYKSNLDVIEKVGTNIEAGKDVSEYDKNRKQLAENSNERLKKNGKNRFNNINFNSNNQEYLAISDEYASQLSREEEIGKKLVNISDEKKRVDVSNSETEKAIELQKEYYESIQMTTSAKSSEFSNSDKRSVEELDNIENLIAKYKEYKEVRDTISSSKIKLTSDMRDGRDSSDWLDVRNIIGARNITKNGTLQASELAQELNEKLGLFYDPYSNNRNAFAEDSNANATTSIYDYLSNNMDSKENLAKELQKLMDSYKTKTSMLYSVMEEINDEYFQKNGTNNPLSDEMYSKARKSLGLESDEDLIYKIWDVFGITHQTDGETLDNISKETSKEIYSKTRYGEKKARQGVSYSTPKTKDGKRGAWASPFARINDYDISSVDKYADTYERLKNSISNEDAIAEYKKIAYENASKKIDALHENGTITDEEYFKYLNTSDKIQTSAIIEQYDKIISKIKEYNEARTTAIKTNDESDIAYAEKLHEELSVLITDYEKIKEGKDSSKLDEKINSAINASSKSLSNTSDKIQASVDKRLSDLEKLEQYLLKSGNLDEVSQNDLAFLREQAEIVKNGTDDEKKKYLQSFASFDNVSQKYLVEGYSKGNDDLSYNNVYEKSKSYLDAYKKYKTASKLHFDNSNDIEASQLYEDAGYNLSNAERDYFSIDFDKFRNSDSFQKLTDEEKQSLESLRFEIEKTRIEKNSLFSSKGFSDEKISNGILSGMEKLSQLEERLGKSGNLDKFSQQIKELRENASNISDLNSLKLWNEKIKGLDLGTSSIQNTDGSYNKLIENENTYLELLKQINVLKTQVLKNPSNNELAEQLLAAEEAAQKLEEVLSKINFVQDYGSNLTVQDVLDYKSIKEKQQSEKFKSSLLDSSKEESDAYSSFNLEYGDSSKAATRYLNIIRKISQTGSIGEDQIDELAKLSSQLTETIEKEYEYANSLEKVENKQNALKNRVSGGISDIFNSRANELIHYGSDKLESKSYDSDTISAIKEQINKISELRSKIKDVNVFDSEEVRKYAEELAKAKDELKNLVSFQNELASDLSIEKMSQRIEKRISDWSGMSDDFKKRFEDIRNSINEANANGGISNGTEKEYYAQIVSLENEVIRKGQDIKSFGTVVGEHLKSINAQFIATYFSVMDFVRYAQQAVEVTKELDDNFTEMRKVSNETASDIKEYQSKSFKDAFDLGTTASDLQSSTADWMRLGETLDEAAESAKVTNELMSVSEFDSVDEATDSLVAMSQAYGDLEKIDIVDKLNNIGNNFSISTDEIATALEKSASALTTSGNSIDESIALITAGNAVVQDPDSVGAGIKTISLRILGTEAAREELEDDGEDTEDFDVTTTSKKRKEIMDLTAVASNGYKGFDILDSNGNYKSTYEIMQGIADIYNEILETDKQYGTNMANGLLESLAGKNRANIAASILQNPDMLRNVYESSQNSEGSADEELNKYIDSITGRLSQLEDVGQSIVSKIFNSEALKNVIRLFTQILNIVNALVSSLGTFGTIVSGGLIGRTVFQKVKAYKQKNSDLDGEGNVVSDTGGTKKVVSEINAEIADGMSESVSTVKTSMDSIVETFKSGLSKILNITKESQDAQAEATESGESKEVLATEESESAQLEVTEMSETGEVVAKEGSLAKTTLGSFISGLFGKGAIGELFAGSESIGGLFSGLAEGAAALLPEIAAMAGSFIQIILVMEVLSKAIETVSKFIDDHYLTADEASDATNQMIDTSKTQKETAKENSSSVEDYKKEYKKLINSGQVNTSTNENLSMSTDDYERYLEITNDIAEMYPELKKGTDANGNALLDLAKGYDTVTDAAEKAEKAAYAVAFNGDKDIDNSGFKSIAKNYLSAKKGTEKNNAFDDFKTSINGYLVGLSKDYSGMSDSQKTLSSLIVGEITKSEATQISKSSDPEQAAKDYVDKITSAILSGRDKLENAYNEVNNIVAKDSLQTTSNISKMNNDLQTIADATGKNVDDIAELLGADKINESEKAFQNSLSQFKDSGDSSYKELVKEAENFGTTSKEAFMSAAKGCTSATEALGKYKQELIQTKLEAGEEYDILGDQTNYTSAKSVYDGDDEDFTDYGETYSGMSEILTKAKELYDSGDTGTKTFKQYAELFSPSGLDTSDAFKSNYSKLKKYFTENTSDGMVAFLKDLSKKGYATQASDGSWQIDSNNDTFAEMAKSMNIAEEPFRAIMDELQAKGFSNDFFDTQEDGLTHLASLEQELLEAKQKVTELDEEGGTKAEKKSAKQQVKDIESRISSTKEALDGFTEESQAEQDKKALEEAKAKYKTAKSSIYDIINGKGIYKDWGTEEKSNALAGLLEGYKEAGAEVQKYDEGFLTDYESDIEKINKASEKAKLWFSIDENGDDQRSARYESATSMLDQLEQSAQDLNDEELSKEVSQWRKDIEEAYEAGETIPDEWVKTLSFKVEEEDLETQLKEIDDNIKSGQYVTNEQKKGAASNKASVLGQEFSEYKSQGKNLGLTKDSEYQSLLKAAKEYESVIGSDKFDEMSGKEQLAYVAKFEDAIVKFGDYVDENSKSDNKNESDNDKDKNTDKNSSNNSTTTTTGETTTTTNGTTVVNNITNNGSGTVTTGTPTGNQGTTPTTQTTSNSSKPQNAGDLVNSQQEEHVEYENSSPIADSIINTFHKIFGDNHTRQEGFQPVSTTDQESVNNGVREDLNQAKNGLSVFGKQIESNINGESVFAGILGSIGILKNIGNKQKESNNKLKNGIENARNSVESNFNKGEYSSDSNRNSLSANLKTLFSRFFPTTKVEAKEKTENKTGSTTVQVSKPKSNTSDLGTSSASTNVESGGEKIKEALSSAGESAKTELSQFGQSLGTVKNNITESFLNIGTDILNAIKNAFSGIKITSSTILSWLTGGSKKETSSKTKTTKSEKTSSTKKTNVQSNKKSSDNSSTAFKTTVFKADTSQVTKAENQFKKKKSSKTVAIKGNTDKAKKSENSFLKAKATKTISSSFSLKGAIEDLANWHPIKSIKAKLTGGGTVNGTAHASGTVPKISVTNSRRKLVKGSLNHAYASGNWGLDKDETALTGELGQELVVRGDNWFTVGDNGAEFANLKKGDIVFNHKQTEDLFKDGYVTGRGKAHAQGTVGKAFAGGSGGSIGGTSGGDKETKKTTTATDNNTSATNKNTKAKKEETKTSTKVTNSASKLSKMFENFYDWIEVWIDRVNAQIDTWSKNASLVLSTITSSKTLKSQLEYYNKSQALAQKSATKADSSAEKYLATAKKTNLSSTYKKKIEEALTNNDYKSIEKIKDKKKKPLRTKIELYVEWYQKYLDVLDQQLDWQQQVADLEQDKLDAIKTHYETLQEVYNTSISNMDALIDEASKAGVVDLSDTNYNKKISSYSKILALQKEERDKMQEELDYGVSKGYIKKNSDTYKTMKSSIDSLDASIASTQGSIYEVQQAIQDKLITKITNAGNVIDAFSSKLSSLNDLYSKHHELVSENLIDEQIANNNLKIENSQQKADAYLSQILQDLSKGGSLNDYLSQNYGITLSSDSIQRIMKAIETGNEAQIDKAFIDAGVKEGLSGLTQMAGDIQNYIEASTTKLSTMATNEDLFDQKLENAAKKVSDYKEYLEDIRSAEESALELEKAQYNLDKAQNNLTEKTWNGKEWVYTYDEDAVKEAKESLDDLEFQQLTDSLDKLSTAIDDLKYVFNLYDDEGNVSLSGAEALNKIEQALLNLGYTGYSEKTFESIFKSLGLFANGGVISGGKNDSVVIRTSEGERVLTPIQNENFEKLVGISSEFVEFMQNGLSAVKTDINPFESDYSMLNKALDNTTQNSQNQTINQTFNISLPNVTNETSAEKLMSDLQNLSLKKIQYFNKQI